MALLHYQNITDHRPDVLMKKTFYGMRIFYDFLDRAKKHLESDKAVKRLGWKPVEKIEKAKLGDTGYWIQLIEPEDRPNEPEATFRAFLDENNTELYEVNHNIRSSRDQIQFSPKNKVDISDRDPEKEQLSLNRKPECPFLTLRPNTWPLACQIKAIKDLQDSPLQAQRPLLRLFEATDHARWPVMDRGNEVASWYVLKGDARPGTREQREFVEIALNTPDFAFLEGPPGSGKTTAICELILQLANQGKRVLLCASTHVAVDNVLERLMSEGNPHRDLIIPIRIGDRKNVSEMAKDWQLETFIDTESNRLLSELKKCKQRTGSQEELLKQIRKGKDTIQRMVLEAANLVCGTTIGFLQHPDIKNKGSSKPQFDVMIIDEASKTTFQEFLVPALLAKRWVLVGDPKQLSPYVDDESTAVNIEPCLPESYKRNACIDVFLAAKQRRAVLVCSDNEQETLFYQKQAIAHKVDISGQGINEKMLPYASLVIGNKSFIEDHIDRLPLDISLLRAPEDELLRLRSRVEAYKSLAKLPKEDAPDWSGEVAWRIARHYEQRYNTSNRSDGPNRKSTSVKLEEAIDHLLPYTEGDDVWNKIDHVRRVALPSVLESLQEGFERNRNQKAGTALSDGLPREVMNSRHVLLETQHRMHPDIAEFPHHHIYEEKALNTPAYMFEKRSWSYNENRHRAIWLDVKGYINRKTNANKKEANAMIKELKDFDDWAKDHPRNDGEVWEVAVLTFYRGQERALGGRMRNWTGDRSAVRHFYRGSKQNPYMNIQVCTVDRFQGQEADLVLLSFMNDHPTSFLESPNRLNVAITRARYQLIVFGDRQAMQRASGLLGEYAKSVKWEQSIREQS